MRKYLLVCIFVSVAALGQQPAFEVASIRSAAQITPEMITSGKLHVGMKVDAGKVDIGYLSLRELIPMAYDVKPFQVTGPDWLSAQRFDILAKLPEGATKEQVPAMLRALLEDRFKLKAHIENKEQPVYSLEVAKNGPKFKEAPAQTDAPQEPQGKADLVIGAGDQQVRINRAGPGQNGGQSMVMSGGQNGTTKVTMGANGQMHMEMERMTMTALAQALTPMLDRPVVDHTDLKGAYTIALDLSMQDLMQVARAAGVGGAGAAGFPPAAGGPAGFAPGPIASDPSGGSIFMSVQQLGLRLDKTKAPMESLVVDSVEKNPTDN
jgi:uncharacterized protein (TIGR03435 family)